MANPQQKSLSSAHRSMNETLDSSAIGAGNTGDVIGVWLQSRFGCYWTVSPGLVMNNNVNLKRCRKYSFVLHVTMQVKSQATHTRAHFFKCKEWGPVLLYTVVIIASLSCIPIAQSKRIESNQTVSCFLAGRQFYLCPVNWFIYDIEDSITGYEIWLYSTAH